jgi:mercuric ion transport protein
MSKRDGAAVVGVGVAACAVCCAGPILAFLGAIGLGTLLGVAVVGVVGLVVALLAVPVVLRWRRRRRCSDPVASVPVAAPKMRAR